MNRHSSRSHAVCVVTVQRTVGAKTELVATGEAADVGDLLDAGSDEQVEKVV